MADVSQNAVSAGAQPEDEQVADVLAVDVLVVCGGGSGLAAADRAAEWGSQVLVVEKEDRIGGTTAMSVDSITASRTRMQRRAGITGSSADFGGRCVDNLSQRRNHHNSPDSPNHREEE